MRKRNQFQTISYVFFSFVFTLAAFNSQAAKLDITYFPTDAAGFSRAPVLVSNDSEAILIDGGFTFSDASKTIQAIKESGKTLKTIFVSHNDPDYYFNLKPIAEAFPDAQVLAAPDTVAAIKQTVELKIKAWGDTLKDNGPKAVSDVIIPTPYTASTLKLGDEVIDIKNAEAGLPDRHYLWIPSVRAIVGGVLVFTDMHVWMADTQTKASRLAWIKTLDKMIAMKPEQVVPGHMLSDSSTNASALTFTRDYLVNFENAANADKSEVIIADMQALYPELPGEGSLQLGAKVIAGEMQWP